MLQKLIPTRYDGVVPLGGSTKPWKIFAINDPVEEDPDEVSYVVKLFSPKNVVQQPCIGKEFICNLLASEFDLIVPEPGIINLNNQDFLDTLNIDSRITFNKKYKGNTFASKLLDAVLFVEKVEDTFLNIADKAMIYAFDFFIFNIDRWGLHEKANLLIYNENFLLIDHELSLSFIDNSNPKTLKAILNSLHNTRTLYPFEYHLFYNSLKLYNGKKDSLFNTFHEYLKILNVVKINNLIKELEENNISTGDSNLLIEYIIEIKNNSQSFCEILLKTVL